VSADGTTVWFSDLGNHRIRTLNTGTVTTIAGNGNFGFAGDGAAAISAEFGEPGGIARDIIGNVYVADGLNRRVRMISWATGNVTTIAGNGHFRYGGDGGPATNAYLQNTGSLAVDSSGNLFIGDTFNQVVRRVDPSGTIQTFAGTGSPGSVLLDGGPATSAPLSTPYGVAVRPSDNAVAIGESWYRGRLRVVTNPAGIISSVSTPGGFGYIMNPLAVDSAGNFYIGQGNQVFKVPAGGGSVTAFAGTGVSGYTGDGGPATAATLTNVGGLAFNAAGDLFISDSNNNVVRMVDYATGNISTVAGNGTWGNSGDGGAATSATFAYPYGLAVDSAGHVFVVSQGYHVVRMFTVGGNIKTVAGTGSYGETGDGGLATSASLAGPFSLAVDAAGNLYIGEDSSGRVRKVSPPAGGF